MMGDGRIHETVLSLMLSGDLPRRRIVSLLRSWDTGASQAGGSGLFPALPGLSPDYDDIRWDRRAEARKLLADLNGQGVRMICLADAAYPPLLKEIPAPPPVLFHKGDLSDVCAGGVAVVGSRRASLSGIRFAAHLAGELARLGFIVVSGLARGIDTAAHRGALEAGGRTIAVLGCGIDQVYPPENQGLMGEIADSGAVVTEFMPGVQPLKPNFPQRNRIISGLCLGTVVVEAGERSGALITASCALEQNRSVFAVPGAPGFYGSKGTNSLLKQGARLVDSVQDILDELAPQMGVPRPSGFGDHSPPASSDSEAVVLELLSAAPVHVDELCRSLDLESRDVIGILFSLETRGLVRSMPGKFYVRAGAI
jgi:DNA processing protein